jgi:hypothetical protein
VEIAGLEGVLSLPDTWKSEAGDVHLTTPSKPRFGSGFDGQGRLLHRQGVENVILRHESCLNKFGHRVEKQRTDVEVCLYAFLPRLTSLTFKSRETYFMIYLRAHFIYRGLFKGIFGTDMHFIWDELDM